METTGPAERYLTPAELAARWKVDLRTADKLCDHFGIQWGWLGPRIRRVSVIVVERVEREKGLLHHST